MSEKLKACPFCGGIIEIGRSSEVANSDQDEWELHTLEDYMNLDDFHGMPVEALFFECPSCNWTSTDMSLTACKDHHENIIQAVQKMNLRPAEDALRAEVVEAQRCYDYLASLLERRFPPNTHYKVEKVLEENVELQAEVERLRELVEDALNHTTGADWFKFEKEAEDILSKYEPVTVQEAMRRQEGEEAG